MLTSSPVGYHENSALSTVFSPCLTNSSFISKLEADKIENGDTMMSNDGLIHVYYGYGKGKTTAALGLALRASGCGKRVVIVQFLKDSKSGELNQLALLPNITVLRGKAPGGVFVKDMDDAAKAETRAIHNANLEKALTMQQGGECDLLILDEALDAYQLGLLDEALLSSAVRDKPAAMELVITGHKETDWITDCADYVTEMAKKKHPYDKGIPGRRGIEF